MFLEMITRMWGLGTSLVLLSLVIAHTAVGQTLVEQDFAPVVTATCKAGYMTIKVATNQSFVGAVHARDYRTPSCISYGNGTHMTSLVINMLANQGSSDYCGVFVNNKTEERSLPIAVRIHRTLELADDKFYVITCGKAGFKKTEERSLPIAVRIHRTLELADDKFYVITCGKAGFKNARNETSLVSLKLMENGHRVQEVYYGRPYTLRADISRPDGTYGIRVKSCYAFSKRNRSLDDNLIDDRGCANNKQIISEFKYNEKLGYADATIFSMFRFPESSELHLQCDIAVCKGACPEVNCDDELSPLARAQPKDIYSETPDEGVIMASTTVFVLEPGDAPLISELCDDGTIRPSWLLYLCIAFGLMFLIMLIINVFLCSAMTCACARTEVIEKEPSIIEDYDPYRSWHGSQYGSRYSLNGKPGYVSGGSTMNSTRSISTNSDHYAIVHSRPGSRYSPGQKNGHRGPSSNLGSHYSGKM